MDMQTPRLRTAEQLRAFVEGNESATFQPKNRADEGVVLLLAAVGIWGVVDRQSWQRPDLTKRREGGGRVLAFALPFVAAAAGGAELPPEIADRPLVYAERQE